MKSDEPFTYEDAQRHEKQAIYPNSIFHAMKTFPKHALHMENVKLELIYKTPIMNKLLGTLWFQA